MMIEKEKYIGESKLSDNPSKKVGFKIKDNTISTEKLKDGAVTEDKLSDDVREKLNSFEAMISLGFYDDEDPPSPILMLPVRPENINETVVPYLLMGQYDISDTVIEWRWKRESQFPDADEYWNMQEKAVERRLHLTNEDFPSGWSLGGNRLSFKCIATFDREGDREKIINVITIK